MSTHSKKIVDLVKENYVYAHVLHHWGVRFYEYSENTLAEVCSEKGIHLEVLIKQLENSEKFYSDKASLLKLPINLVIEYLKYTHYIFIKQKLPYITHLIENCTTTSNYYQDTLQDLKVVFPLFVEDFIHHIYEEEDTLFSYINKLQKTLISPPKNISEVYYMLEKCSIRDFALDHEHHDDEMAGISLLTNKYHISNDADLHVKVIFSELQTFEKELSLHAKIENEVLFPKALILENEVVKIYNKHIKLN